MLSGCIPICNKLKTIRDTIRNSIQHRVDDTPDRITPHQETRLQIENRTTVDITNTTITSINDLDWNAKINPKRNFTGVTIKAKATVERKEEVKRFASNCSFTMTLHFRDNLKDTFTINQKYALGDCPSGFEHHEQNHKITYEREGDKTLKIIVEHIAQQLQENSAKNLIAEAMDELKNHNFDLALELLHHARQHAIEQSTIELIRNCKKKVKNGQAIELEKHGEKLIKWKEYDAAIDKFDEALHFANEPATIELIKKNKIKAENLRAKQLIKEAEELLKLEDYNEAIKKLDEALKVANEAEIVNKIIAIKATACNESAKLSLQKGWDLEQDTKQDNTDEAKKCFDLAKLLFLELTKIKQVPENENNLANVDIKITGNKIFNEAMEMEKEANKLFRNARNSAQLDQYWKAHDKYNESLKSYKAAKEKIDEGVKMTNDEKFQECSQFMGYNINAVTTVVGNLNKVKLKHVVRKAQLLEDVPLQDEPKVLKGKADTTVQARENENVKGERIYQIRQIF